MIEYAEIEDEKIKRLKELYKEFENPTPRNRAERREQARREKRNKRK